MIRINIDISKNINNCLIQTRGDVASILKYILQQKGIPTDCKKPAQWGFGVVTHKTESDSSYQRLEKIILGTSSQQITECMKSIQVEDFIYANQSCHLKMNFSDAKIKKISKPLNCEAMIFKCISPIHVKDEFGKEFLKLGSQLNDYINRSMKKRFSREFNLKILPQIQNVSFNEKFLTVKMAHGINSKGYPIINKGVVCDFILSGSVQDINDAYFSGLGSKTARGFGCIMPIEY